MTFSASEQHNIELQELVRKSLEGDLSAFRRLMDSQQRYAYILAVRLLRDAEDANDVVQEAFVRVWRNLAAYSADVKFTTWLYTIVVHLSYDTLKKRSRKGRIFGYGATFFRHSEVADASDLQEKTERADLCDQILAKAQELPPMEKLVFHLRDVEDFTSEEVAGLTGISVGSVKTNLCYARKRIRAAMASLQEGGQA